MRQGTDTPTLYTKTCKSLKSGVVSLQTFEDIDLFHLIGVICGLAIYNLTIVELHFPVALYKKLLKRNPTLDDLKELMPDVGRLGLTILSLSHLLSSLYFFLTFCQNTPFHTRSLSQKCFGTFPACVSPCVNGNGVRNPGTSVAPAMKAVTLQGETS